MFLASRVLPSALRLSKLLRAPLPKYFCNKKPPTSPDTSVHPTPPPSNNSSTSNKAHPTDIGASTNNPDEFKHVGLNMFINRVYITTGMSFLTTFSTSFIASSIPYFVVNPIVCMMTGSALGFAGFFAAYKMKPIETEVFQSGKSYIKTTNSGLRLGLYGLGCVGMGVALLPLALMTAAISPQILSNMITLTLGSFGGASLVIYALPKRPLFQEGGLLGAALGGFVAMSVSRYINSAIYGEYFMSNFVGQIDTYGGIFLFFYLIIYNTRLAIQQYELGKADHLGVGIQFIFDVLSFFYRMLRRIFVPNK